MRVGFFVVVASCQWLATAASGEVPTVDAATLRAVERAAQCGSLKNSVGPWDYRLRETTGRLSWDHADNMTHHYEPAVTRMHTGEYSQRVLHDLDFLVRVWPNHELGLRALMEYEAGGGRVHNYRAVDCYFERARRFAPDDVAVMLLEGHYFRKRKDWASARESYEAALALQPDSADVRYNVGLFYAEIGEYDKAVENARVAYSLGYPLPGLRNKLARSGHWPDEVKDPQQQASPPPPQ